MSNKEDLRFLLCRLSCQRKYFWACEATCVLVLEGT